MIKPLYLCNCDECMYWSAFNWTCGLALGKICEPRHPVCEKFHSEVVHPYRTDTEEQP